MTMTMIMTMTLTMANNDFLYACNRSIKKNTAGDAISTWCSVTCEKHVENIDIVCVL